MSRLSPLNALPFHLVQRSNIRQQKAACAKTLCLSCWVHHLVYEPKHELQSHYDFGITQGVAKIFRKEQKLFVSFLQWIRWLTISLFRQHMLSWKQMLRVLGIGSPHATRWSIVRILSRYTGHKIKAIFDGTFDFYTKFSGKKSSTLWIMALGKGLIEKSPFVSTIIFLLLSRNKKKKRVDSISRSFRFLLN